MSARSIRAGEAFYEITARDKTDAGIKSAMGRMKSFASAAATIGAGLTGIGASFSALGSAILTPLGMASKHFADAGSSLHDLAARTGESVENLSRLKYAAEQSGASLTDIELAIKTMQRKGFKGTFAEMAKAIAGIEDPAERTRAAMEAWGKSGTKLLAMINDLPSLTGQADLLGLTVSTEDAAAADALGDAYGALMEVVKDLKFEIGAALASSLTRALDTITPMLAQVNAWISQNRGLVVSLALVAIGLLAIGGTLVSLGGAFIAVASAIAGVSALLQFLITPIGAIVIGITALVALLIGGAAAWLIFTEAGRKAADDFGTFMGGIFDAIANGDIMSAWAQLSAGMTIIWLEMVKTVKAAFFSMARTLAFLTNDMLKDMADLLDMVGATDLAGKARATGTLLEAGTGLIGTASLEATNKAQQEALLGLKVLRDLAHAKRQKAIDDATQGAAVAASSTTAAGGSSSGTFNAAAAGLLGRSGGPLDRTAKGIESMDKKMTAMLEKLGLLKDIKEGIDDIDPLAFE